MAFFLQPISVPPHRDNRTPVFSSGNPKGKVFPAVLRGGQAAYERKIESSFNLLDSRSDWTLLWRRLSGSRTLRISFPLLQELDNLRFVPVECCLKHGVPSPKKKMLGDLASNPVHSRGRFIDRSPMHQKHFENICAPIICCYMGASRRRLH
jgi:hypothetical protein